MLGDNDPLRHEEHFCILSILEKLTKHAECDDIFRDVVLNGVHLYEPIDKGRLVQLKL